MNLARTDTYINVYLPRENGDDPRRYAQSTSPLFNEDTVYKFSDEIIKDRKLFLGKKQMSLYEIYYKDDKDSSNKRVTIENGESDVDVERHNTPNEEDLDGLFARRSPDSTMERVQLPRVNKISLSLDRKLRRVQRTHLSRFNEPVPSWTTTTRLRSDVSPSSSTDISPNRSTRTHTQGAARTHNMYRLFKKAQSAPLSDGRHVRVLGLPPISRTNTTMNDHTDTTEILKAKLGIGATLPLRPSSKPNRIWRQSTNMFQPGYNLPADSLNTSLQSMGRMSTRGSSRLRPGPIHGSVWT